jgi:DedD protein
VLSIPQRKDNPAGTADEAASVQAARTRARRRLLGAAVLVGLGIVGFPLLFETQPRPIPVDIPIEVGPRASAPAPLAAKPASSPAVVARAQPAAPVESEAEVPVAASAPPPPASATAAPVQPVAPAASTAAEIEREAQRAQALLDGKPVAALPTVAEPKAASRFVVQAGAYTDAAALREARQKVEKLGLKTYTQVVETDSGARTRVRVGPFDNRDEAEKAAARIKSAGLAANVLSL